MIVCVCVLPQFHREFLVAFEILVHVLHVLLEVFLLLFCQYQSLSEDKKEQQNIILNINELSSLNSK
jgi:hypothetical protein